MAPPILKMEMKMGGLRGEQKNQVRHTIKNRHTSNSRTHHAMGKVTNNDINCIKLNPIDFAPSDSSKRPPSDNVIKMYTIRPIIPKRPPPMATPMFSPKGGHLSQRPVRPSWL